MCGLVGAAGPHGSVFPDMLRTRVLAHRGPDAIGEFAVRLPWGDVRLGGTRLGIVDARREVPVPFKVGYDPAVLAFVGEVYNHAELRLELSDGVPWASRCDTEAVLRAWRRWGPGMLDRMNGMWGLALADPARGELFLARDPKGAKPLYYAWHRDVLHFASEVKALGVPLSEGPCPDADVLEFDCGRQTPFAGVYALQPGEYLLVRGQQVVHHAYFSLPPSDPDPRLTFDAAAEELTALVKSAIEIRFPAECSCALLLSGGLDSAIIQAVLQLPAERLYTVTFPEQDVLSEAEAASLGEGVTPVTFTLNDVEEVLPRVMYHLDTPATWTAVCQWFVCEQMGKDGHRVVLSGEGADELLLGYTRYRLLYWLDRMAGDPHCTGYEPAMQNLHGTDRIGLLARVLDRSGGQALEHARSLCQAHSLATSLVEDMARIDYHTTMQVLLRMADRMAAAFSMEGRAPFLDPRIIAFSQKLPVAFRVNEHESKAVLRQVARRLGVPAPITEERTKRGFCLPWNQWSRAGEGTLRGVWDRGAYATWQKAVWRDVFFGAGLIS